jgi:uroporphyrinogen-III synthase
VKILVTRPEPGASATAERLQSMGHEAVLAPCLAITLIPPRLPEHAAALIVTSGQAVPALPESLHHVPAFCVGDVTAGKMRAAGFARVESANGDANDLFRLITARHLPGTHILVAGEGNGMRLLGQLREAGIRMLRRKVYAARPIRRLPADASLALAEGEIAAALFYSAETARAFVRMKPPGTDRIAAFALSRKVAAALGGLPWSAIHVALAPTEADMMALLP